MGGVVSAAAAKGFYSVVRENALDHDKEVDGSALADGVACVPIEIKPLGRYSVSALKNVLREQLVGKYMRPHDRRHGILLVVRRDRKSWRVGGKDVGLERLLKQLRIHAAKLGSAEGKVVSVEVIDLLSP